MGVVLLNRTEVAGLQGGGAGAGVSAAAAAAMGLLSNQLSTSTNDPAKQKPVQVDELAAALSQKSGTAFKTQSQSMGESVSNASVGTGGKDNSTSVSR